MISVEEARQRVLAGLSPAGSEVVALSEAFGRVLAEDVAARLTHPPSTVSAMDGYAVRAADAQAKKTTLTVIGESAAGHGFAGSIGPGQAARIFTGAPLPAGADTVVMQEDVSRDGESVVLNEPAEPGRHVRAEGLDFRAGHTQVRAGRGLTARDIGLLAAMNVPWVRVRRRPRVAILSTGDEVVMPGDPVGPDQIVGSNGLALAAMVMAAGGIPVHVGIAADRHDALGAMVAEARGADLLVTSGGASVGEYDLVKDALGAAGLEMDFYKIAMRPGKPLMFGRLGPTPVLGLPGNPVSALVCAVIFLIPALRAMVGLPPGPRTVTASLGCAMPAGDPREEYLRCVLSRNSADAITATPFEVQDSAVMSVLARADGLLIRSPRALPAQSGDPVRVIAFEGGF